MKKFLLLILGMLAAIPSLHAYTAADFEGKIVGIIIGGSEIYNAKLVSLQQTYFERNGADNKVTLKNVVLWNHVYDVNFTISGSQLIMDFDSGTYYQSLKAKDTDNYLAQIREFQNGLNSNNANYASAYVYVPSNANHNQIAFSISDTGNDSYCLNFSGYFGVVNSQQTTLKLTAQNARIFCNCTIHVYPQNAIHYYKVSAVNDFAWNGNVEELPCRISFANASDGYNFHIYNWNGEGWAWDSDQTGGGIGAVVGTISGNTSSTSGSVTLPIQKYNYTTTITPKVYGQGTANCYKNGTNYGTGYAYSPTSTMNATSWTTTMLDADFNTLPISGNYVRGTQHAGFTDVPLYLWDQSSQGKLVTQDLVKIKFGTWCEYEESYDITTRAYESIVESPNGDSQPITLALENNMAQCGVTAPTDKYPVYVAGNLHLTENAQFFDHAELYLVSGRTTSVADRTDLNTDTGINGALNITAHKHSWNMVACGILSQAELEAMDFTAEAWDTYAENNLMRNYNGYIYYNQLVPKADLAAANMLPPAQPAQAPGVRRQMQSQEFPYSVFAKVYYTAASGLQPTFHGLTTRWTTTGIDDASVAPMNPATEVGHYDLQGRRIEADAPGVHIIRMSDGTARKSVVK